MKKRTKTGLTRKLILFSIPLILSGLLQQFYSWADAFIVGNFQGESALAAIGATGVIAGLFIMAITGFTSGITILSARCFGSRDTTIQKRILSTFTVLLSVVFLLLSLVGILFTEKILGLLQTPADIFETAKGYLRIVLFGIPSIAIYNVYAAVLRGNGNSKAPFFAVMVSSVANVLLDILFVIVLRRGAEGAALATVISQTLMAGALVIYTVKQYDFLRFRFHKAMVNLSVLKEGSALALPIMIQSVISSAGNVVLQNFMNGFGTPTVAAITTAYRVDSIIMLPAVNLGTGIATITAQYSGAGDDKQAKRTLYVGSGLMILVSACLTAIVLPFGGDLVELFGLTISSTQIGRAFFSSIAWFYIIFGLSMSIRGYLEGRGDVIFTSVCGILTLGVRIVLSYVMVSLFDNMVIAYAEAFSWCFLLILFVSRFIWIKNRYTKSFVGIKQKPGAI